MGRIVALDYGTKRTGVAVTDPMKIIASPLVTVSTANLFEFILKYVKQETVETIVVGLPKRLNEEDTHATQPVRQFIKQLREKLPHLHIVEEDERFTSKMAMDAMIKGGMKKKDRRKKENVDKVSAALILQSYLEHHGSV